MSKLLAYRASAGSGKTFTLTKEFLLMLFKDEMSFRHILAITFTNKASTEMKSRIISQLYALSNGQGEAYRKIIFDELGFDNEQIIEKSKNILLKILHNYSFFFVETIDKFYQRVVRNFAKELGIYSLQNVELDNNRILDLAIKQLLIDIDNDPEIKAWLNTFISHQIAVGESYNVRRKIIAIGKEMFSESVSDALQKNNLFFENRPQIDKLYCEYEAIINQTDECLREIAQNALSHIEHFGLTIDDFSYGTKGAVNFFNKLQNRDYEPSKRVMDAISDPSSLIAKSSKKKNELQQCIDSGLTGYFEEAISLLDKTSEKYHTAHSLLEFRHTFPMLTRLFSKVMDYCRENDIHLLSNNNILLRQIIDDESTPFVYEKMGTFLRNFMLDEFQDTSSLQWENIKPLLYNGLGEGFDSLVVGDVKQSIYRWRNGDWRLLADSLPKDKDLGSMVDTRHLVYNYRSDPQIINFNNTIFTGITSSVKQIIDGYLLKVTDKEEIPEYIKNLTDITYDDVCQKIPDHTKSDGYVSLEFFPEKELSQQLIEKLPSIIMQLQDNGYTPSDIAIIVRSNKECKDIVNILLDYKQKNAKSKYIFDVVSSEALELGRSSALRIIINILRASINSKDTISKRAVFEDYNNHFSNGKNVQSYEELITANNINIDDKNSLFEKCEELIGKLNLATNESFPYIKDFQDLVLQHSVKSDYSIHSFIEWWNEKGSSISVKLPEGQTAIQVLTIHKSKGLEFNAVILPYCNWKIYSNDTILWVKNPRSEFPIHPVRVNKNMLGGIFRNDYIIEKIQQLFDNLNLLYVAFTRAKRAMFILSETCNRDLDGTANVGNLIFNSLEEKSIKIEHGNLIPFNRKNTMQTDNIIGNYSYYGLSENIYFATHAGDFFNEITEKNKQNVFGIAMHDIFSNIETHNDIDSAIRKTMHQGLISETEAETINKFIYKLLQNNTVCKWFDGSYQILNETAILLPHNTMKRPDRIMIDGNNAIIVDYKFTRNKELAHQKQVMEYSSLLTEMGFNCKSYIWYVMLDAVEAV